MPPMRALGAIERLVGDRQLDRLERAAHRTGRPLDARKRPVHASSSRRLEVGASTKMVSWTSPRPKPLPDRLLESRKSGTCFSDFSQRARFAGSKIPKFPQFPHTMRGTPVASITSSHGDRLRIILQPCARRRQTVLKEHANPSGEL
jgi:hypothetical protein